MTVPAEVRARLGVVLVMAVLGLSSSAILVRGMDAGPLAIAAWRCLFAAVLLAPAIRSGWPSTRDLAWIGLGGVFLGLHFGAWFASVQLTTILRSTVLVALVPVWTGLAEWSLFGVRPSGRFWLGIGLALAGVGWMSAEDLGQGSLLGDALSVLAGALWAVYLLAGRWVRGRVEVGAYMGLVSAAASISCFALGFAVGEPLIGFPPATWALFVLATLGPQLVGHQGFAYAMRWVPAATISALCLLEPVGATLLAALILREVPTVGAGLGGLLALLGVWIALSPTAGGGSRAPAT
jgi:drug/metabolite transporter (DMT)-like permease